MVLIEEELAGEALIINYIYNINKIQPIEFSFSEKNLWYVFISIITTNIPNGKGTSIQIT